MLTTSSSVMKGSQPDPNGGVSSSSSASLPAPPVTTTPLSAATKSLQVDTRLLEANLLHHYYTHTHLTVADDNHSRTQWHSVLSKVATGHSSTVDSLLAFTALHLADLEPNRRQFWTIIAFDYSDKACSALSKIVIRLSAATANGGSDPSANYLDEVLRIAKLVRGCVLLGPKTSSFSQIAEGTDDGRPGSPQDNPQKLTRSYHAASRIHNFASQILSQLYQTPAGIPAQNHAANVAATQHVLSQIAERDTPRRLDMGALPIWPVFFSEAFADLPKARDFVARLIFLLYPLALHFFRDAWFCWRHGEESQQRADLA
ncbi:uncharacterized protein BO97DRAFT_424438 [Aspergillus homomorphus CBS 101889]|uniref:Uncharacterized protein n=1 Tax=Aspergillus homomorphus (strain CBS 101889) TaxID=1450537 RepID=A0A395HZ44_ASPHC|nr:hypothetical protein BO97DRAFT_424438 [Aspergillus homomorphus CBS 101889]RAL12806.1 hypothetical protein BO97DRAFT_424438 [Aspergillus homomorphus CBS 101889]